MSHARCLCAIPVKVAMFYVQLDNSPMVGIEPTTSEVPKRTLRALTVCATPETRLLQCLDAPMRCEE
jgi:hypothetical protein